MMNKKIYIIIGIVVLIIIALVLGGRGEKGTPNEEPVGKLPSGTPEETFSGTLQAVNTGCFADGICSVTIDGKEVIILTGWAGMSPEAKVGKLIGVESIGDLESRIGWHANVYATTTPDGKHTLYGDERYYVEVVKIEQE
jgi:hypothetical protein